MNTSNILIVAEHDNKNFSSVNAHTLSAALKLNGNIDLLLAGTPDKAVSAAACQFSFIREILEANSPDYTDALPENIAPLIFEIGKKYNYILMAATTYGKNILPRVAALFNMGMLSDVVDIISADTFLRPIYAGNALATLQTKEKIKILTIRATAFPAYVNINTDTDTNTITDINLNNINNINNKKNNFPAIQKIDIIFKNTLSKFLHKQETLSSRPSLTSARIIVSGGRGLKSAENFKLLESFADSIGAAVGASRAAVDAGFAPNDYQVGQTGKIVAPEIYIAVGISGAIQHIAGMKESKVIIAINSDPDAPTFEIADYGLVGDLFKILPELKKAFER